MMTTAATAAVVSPSFRLPGRADRNVPPRPRTESSRPERCRPRWAVPAARAAGTVARGTESASTMTPASMVSEKSANLLTGTLSVSALMVVSP